MMTMMMKKKTQENVLNSYIHYRLYLSARCHNTEVCNMNLHILQIQLYPLFMFRSRKDANAKQLYLAS